MQEQEKVHIHISSRHNWLDLRLGEVWRYRDLIRLFTRKNFVVTYKQTILGPAWLVLNPLMSSLVYMVLFGHIARLSTEGVPQLLFYLTGTALWNYFSSCVSNNASTFVSNAHLFGKVYFPRLTVPIANVLSAVLRLGIQLILVLILLAYYAAVGAVAPHWLAWLYLPFVAAQMGVLGMAIGIIVSSLTTKYRDLSVLVGVCIQLWMYATPVVYPLSQLSAGPLRQLLLLNPVTMPMELFRYALLGVGTIEPLSLVLSWAVTLAAALLGVVLFNRVERTFMDTV